MKMNRRAIVLGAFAAGGAVLAMRALGADSPGKRVAFVQWTAQSALKYFRDKLSELGFVDGRNVTIRAWALAGKTDPDAIVNEVMGWHPDVIAVNGTPMSRRFQAATSTIPIVFTVGGDPVDSGLVRDFARPGANVTGVHFSYREQSAKRIEIARELLPKAERLGFIFQRKNTNWGDYLERSLSEMRALAERAGFRVFEEEVMPPSGLRDAFERLVRARVNVLLPFNDIFDTSGATFVEFQRQHRIPVITHSLEGVLRGLVLGLEEDEREGYSRQAALAARVLAGARPGELPVDHATRFIVVANLKAAREIRIEIPQSILARAERVVQ